jgi:acetyltransferase-like isoleucine patch superfamily enzyme
MKQSFINFFDIRLYIFILREFAVFFYDLFKRASLKVHNPTLKIGFLTQIRSFNGLTIGISVSLGESNIISLPDSGNGKIQIDHQVKTSRRVTLGTYDGGFLKIGRGTSLHNNTIVLGDVHIGQNCLISNNVFIASTTHHFKELPHAFIRVQDRIIAKKGYNSNFSKKVIIEDDCWIGWGAVILPGSKIGRGAIIAANAVVRTEVMPYEIYGGVPAKKISNRLFFSPPSYVDSSELVTLPYFYSGFDSCRDSESISEKGFQMLPSAECPESVILLKNASAKELTVFLFLEEDIDNVNIKFNFNNILYNSIIKSGFNKLTFKIDKFLDEGSFEIKISGNDKDKIYIKRVELNMLEDNIL